MMARIIRTHPFIVVKPTGSPVEINTKMLQINTMDKNQQKNMIKMIKGYMEHNRDTNVGNNTLTFDHATYVARSDAGGGVW